MNAPLNLPDPVVPLIARLGSDSDPERLACLRQLDRVLGRAGMSWTDLAVRLTVDAAPSCCTPPRRKRPETDGEILQWLLWEVDCEKISEREGEFLCNLKDSFGYWRADAPDMLRSRNRDRHLQAFENRR